MAEVESTAGSSGEPSDSYCRPLNIGSAKSVPCDGLVEATVLLRASPSPRWEPNGAPSGRLNISALPPSFIPKGAFSAAVYPNAIPPVSNDDPGIAAEAELPPLT